MKPGILHEHTQVLRMYYIMYDKLHRQGFNNPWWRSIPIPFLFKPIQFGELSVKLEKISSVLSNEIIEIIPLTEDKSATDIENKFARVLLNFCESIKISVNLLKNIYQRLDERSKGSRGETYTVSEYENDLKIYHESEKRLTQYGLLLGEMYADLGANDWRRENAG